MSVLDLATHVHRRFNALTGEWILVSPQRTARPWRGQVDDRAPEIVPNYDASCYMCPANLRASGERNPSYQSTFVFTNDFPALTPPPVFDGLGAPVASGSPVASGFSRKSAPAPHPFPGCNDEVNLMLAEAETGTCRVVCFSPRHDLTLSRMTREAIRLVIDLFATERTMLAAREDVRYVQIFENRGAMMGASNPHPHGQIWASASVPPEIVKEQGRQRLYWERWGRDLLGDYLDRELTARTRLVCDNDAFVALVPFWAIWPFETLIVPRRRVSAIDGLTSAERDGLADILKQVLTRCDQLFDAPCPYSMGFHESPADHEPHAEWRWHAHVYPPVLRSASVRKFMVGYELLASPQRDITPEHAAERLRAAGKSVDRTSSAFRRKIPLQTRRDQP